MVQKVRLGQLLRRLTLFRPRKTQKSIFDHAVYSPGDGGKALEIPVMGPFLNQFLSIIEEAPFPPFNLTDNFRRNISIAILAWICILKKMRNLTEKEALGFFECDLRWPYASSINGREGGICQKTQHSFRTLGASNKKAQLA